jgi:sec-independent protein translocase protein TatA
MNFLNLKPLEIILILVVVLLLFGAKRLPEMAKGIGQSVREFRKGIKDMKDDIATEAKVEKVEKEAEKSV